MNKGRLKEIIPALAGRYKFNPRLVEKDFYITMLMNNINFGLSENIVLKGGTLLNKIYFNHMRLSEDLDFSWISGEELNSRGKRSRAIKPIKSCMAAFLKKMGLKSPNPEGEGFNESTQYVFLAGYTSVTTNRTEYVKIEISLRQVPMDRPVVNKIKHFYKDPFTGEDLLPKGTILSLSLNEAVAEKLKAAISRIEYAVRDYYDLWKISESDFDFFDEKFISLFHKKLNDEKFEGGYSVNFGLSEKDILSLKRQVKPALSPVISGDEKFSFEKVLKRFNKILNKI